MGSQRPKPKRRSRSKAASGRPPFQSPHPHRVIYIVAQRGPDGTLHGDVGALLAAAGPRVYMLSTLPPSKRTAAQTWNEAERGHFAKRKAGLTTKLSEIDKDPDRGPSVRHELVKALWPSVQKRLDHHSDIAAAIAARAEYQRAKRTDLVEAVKVLEEISARYRGFDAIWEPVEQAIKGFKQFEQDPDALQRIGPQVSKDMLRRLPKAGQPQMRALILEARKAIALILDEDETTALLRLVGFLPL